jgi:hypothetical protein
MTCSSKRFIYCAAIVVVCLACLGFCNLTSDSGVIDRILSLLKLYPIMSSNDLKIVGHDAAMGGGDYVYDPISATFPGISFADDRQRRNLPADCNDANNVQTQILPLLSNPYPGQTPPE